MGLAAFGFVLGALRIGERKRGAVIDRRLARRHLALAPPVQLRPCFVTGIKPAILLQLLRRCLVMREPVGLAGEQIMLKPQPRQIFHNRRLIFRL